MKTIHDALAALYFFGLLALATLIFPAPFKAATAGHPYAMGWLKFALLATFGEYLKRRIAAGRWEGEAAGGIAARFAIWGLFGVWITAAFALFASGVDALVAKGLWPAGPPLWIAFSDSLWINLLGCYGWSMMLAHEWANGCVRAGRLLTLPAFAETLDRGVWFGKIPLTVLAFWLPAHTVTFALPGEWRILTAAGLSVVLGFLLTAGAAVKK